MLRKHFYGRILFKYFFVIVYEVVMLSDAKCFDISFCAPISEMLANRKIAKLIVVNKGIITFANFI